MLGQKYLAEPSLAQFTHHFILTETVMRIKLFPLGSIERSSIFNKLKIILKILGPLFIKKSQSSNFHQLSNLPESITLVSDLI